MGAAVWSGCRDLTSQAMLRQLENICHWLTVMAQPAYCESNLRPVGNASHRAEFTVAADAVRKRLYPGRRVEVPTATQVAVNTGLYRYQALPMAAGMSAGDGTQQSGVSTGIAVSQDWLPGLNWPGSGVAESGAQRDVWDELGAGFDGYARNFVELLTTGGWKRPSAWVLAATPSRASCKSWGWMARTLINKFADPAFIFLIAA